MKKFKDMTNKELIKCIDVTHVTFLESELASRLTSALAEIETLKAPNPDEIHILWCVEDVIMVAEMDALQEPTVEQAREVLRRAEYEHDATVGINWGTLAHHLRDVLEEDALN